MSARPDTATASVTLKGAPVLMTLKRWNEVKLTQRLTVSASNEATFQATAFRHYEVLPSVMNVYILCDPSKGRTLGPHCNRGHRIDQAATST